MLMAKETNAHKTPRFDRPHKNEIRTIVKNNSAPTNKHKADGKKRQCLSITKDDDGGVCCVCANDVTVTCGYIMQRSEALYQQTY